MSKEQYNPNGDNPYRNLIAVEAAKQGINPDFANYLFWHESRYKADAQSPTGPVGLGQLTKATARASGLRVDETTDERLDPAKNIQASLLNFKRELDAAGGQYDVAALAYNQGRGDKGLPQIEAYKSGNWSAISPEGLNYVKSFMKFSPQTLKSPIELEGISPQAGPVDMASLTQGITKDPAIALGEGLPVVSGLNIQGQAPEAPNESMGETYWKATGETLDQREDRSTWSGSGAAVKAGVGNSLVGQTVMGAVDNGFGFVGDLWSPTRWNTHTWTPEELTKIREAGVLPDYYNVVTGGSPENLDALIQTALENQKRDLKAAQGGTGAQLVGGIAGAVADPLTYVPMVGQSAKAVGLVSKVAKAVKIGHQAGLMNVASEGLRTQIAGGDAKMMQAYVGGLTMGGGFSLVGDAMSSVLGKSPIHGTQTRLENRIEAQLNGTPDPTKIPHMEDEAVTTSPSTGRDYAETMAGDGSVRLEDGSIVSGANPLNPRTQDRLKEAQTIEDKYVPRARKGLKLGGLIELGMTILRSEDATVRALGADLVRSPTGVEGGASGKFGATASDISEDLRYRDNEFQARMVELEDNAFKELGYGRLMGRAPESEKLAMRRRVVEAVEDGTDAKMSALSPSEAAYAKLIREHTNFKADALKRPEQFGNDVKSPIMGDTHFNGTYFPVRYDTQSHAYWLERMGGTQELKEAIKESMLGSYRSSPDIKARVDEYLKTTGQTVEEYAESKAFGIANRGEDTRGQFGGIMEDFEVRNLGDNDYLKARHLFGNDFEVSLPYGERFSINDLRELDPTQVLPAYDRRVNGDIAIMGATGKTTEDLVKQINGISDAQSLAALTEVVKVLTGRSRKDPEGAMATLARGLNDITYGLRNAYMAPQNYTEIGSMIARGGVDSLAYAVPAFRRLMSERGRISKSEVDYISSTLFGRELDDAITPRSQDIIDRLRATGSNEYVAKAVGYTKAFTSVFAARMPMSRAMVGTTNHIIKAARIEALTNAIRSTYGLKVPTNGLNERLLNSASINAKQWANIQSLIRDHVSQDGKYGAFSFKDVEAMRADPRSMDLWRFADHVASETVLRADKVSNQTTKAYGAFAGMFLQFKNFTLRAINSRTMSRYHMTTKDGRGVDTALTTLSGIMLQAAWLIGSTHVRAFGMSEKDRKEYLDRMLDPNMIAMGAVFRSDIIGSIPSAAGMVTNAIGLDWLDYGQMYRTSIAPREPKDRKSGPMGGIYSADNPVLQVAGNVVKQTPSLSLLASGYAAGYNAIGSATAERRVDERGYNDALYKALQSTIPNDPITQRLLTTWAEDELGISAK
ncbi:transglycosylase SLT domain-containing protein [Escherichia coli]|nr:transglycosylase SLT domain-containing protein [Escherichia coli]EJM8824694.1 transglycosylase SLT domain-containing protein [Escherichia coli]